jgi:hypothetical protein
MCKLQCRNTGNMKKQGSVTPLKAETKDAAVVEMIDKEFKSIGVRVWVKWQIECLPNKNEVLSSNLSIEKRKKERKKHQRDQSKNPWGRRRS